MKRLKALAIFNAISFITQLVFSGLTQTRSLNVKTAGEVSAQYETLITPASFIYSIWVIIYTLLGILCLYHIIMAYKHDKTNPANYELSKMGVWFLLLNFSGAAWLVAWTQERLLVSFLLVFMQLICLIIIHIRLNIYRTNKVAAVKVANQFPLSIYLGWISVLALLNTGSYLFSIGWNGAGLQSIQWAITMISFITILSVWIILTRRNIYFGLVVSWFLYGVIEKTSNRSVDSEALIITAWSSIGIIGVFCLIRLVRNLQYKKPREIFPSASMPVK